MKSIKKQNSITFLIFLISICPLGLAQKTDTLKINTEKTDSLFLSRNLSLVAQRFNVNENEAAIIQERIWDLPNISIIHNFYNPANKRFLELSDNSESSVQIQQLILIAGKRDKLVSMARTNKEIAELQFADVLRNLRFQLHSSFYNVYFLELKKKIFDTEIPLIEKVVSAYESSYPKGYVSLKEVVRLKALLFSLQSEKIGVQDEIRKNQGTLHILLNEKDASYIQPLTDTSYINKLTPEMYSLSTLIDTASHARPDLRIFNLQDQYNQLNLSYQKGLNVPNPTFIAGWDHNGGIVRNYNYIGLSFDLPLWNRNHGNIKTTELKMQENKALKENYLMQVEKEVEDAYSQLSETEKIFRSDYYKYGVDYEKIIEGATQNFLKHEIGLLEFIDLNESYKDSQIQLIELQNDRINAFENLSLSVGRSLK